jgi:hypothetical protein
MKEKTNKQDFVKNKNSVPLKILSEKWSDKPENGRKYLQRNLWKTGQGGTYLVIPATQETEEGGSWVWGQFGLHSKTLSQPFSQEIHDKGLLFKLQKKKKTPKIPQQKY